MAIVYDNASFADGNSASPSVSHTASGTDRFVAIGILALGDETISAISYGSQTPTLIRRFNLGFGSSTTIWLYGLVAPATGAQTISVTKSASSLWGIGAVSYTGVDQTTPYDAYAEFENNSASPITVDVASAIGDLVVDLALVANSTATVGAGQTARINTNAAGDLGFRSFCMSEEAGAASVTMSWTSSGPAGRSGIIAVPLNASAPSDTTPDAFSFTPQTGVPASSVRTSNAIEVTGINAAAAISIVNGEYRINGGGWTTAPGTVVNLDDAEVRHTSSSGPGVTTTTTLTIGGVSADFTSTTAGAPVVVMGGRLSSFP